MDSVVIVGVLVAVVLAGIGFFGLYRPWHLAWGATREEVGNAMPGDGVVSGPTFNATRAVTILAPAATIWPWIVQIGFGRAGWYSYDLLDNLGHHSAESVVPKFQDLRVGDLIPMGPGENAGMRVKELNPNRSMVWWEDNHLTTWVWTLDPTPDGRTRLVTRVRSRSSLHHPTTLFWLLIVEAADFPLMRKCLLGIKRRAETCSGRCGEPSPAVPERLVGSA
jgi:hypothetical protein